MKLFYAALFLLSFSSCVTLQTVTAPKMGEIIEVPGTKEELFVKANEWMVRTFNNAKSVIQFQDKEAGKIMGKYLMFSISQVNTDVYSLITISVRDKATKIDIEPMGDWKYDNSGMTVYNYSTEKAQSEIKRLIDDYKVYMGKNKEVW